MSRDCLIRAAKTFVQAFLGVVLTELGAVVAGITDWTDLKALGAHFAPLIAAAVSAGISAAWNTAACRRKSKKLEIEDK